MSDNEIEEKKLVLELIQVLRQLTKEVAMLGTILNEKWEENEREKTD